MTSRPGSQGGKPGLSRRDAISAGVVTCFAARSLHREAAAAESAGNVGYAIEREADIRMADRVGIHEGKGALDLYPFRFGRAADPARFIVYDLPPGASEGVHVHHLDNRNGEGAFDEYYYIVSGEGVMEIDGEPIPVRAGDHVHTPLDVAHGIANTHPSDRLKVFLTYIQRGTPV